MTLSLQVSSNGVLTFGNILLAHDPTILPRQTMAVPIFAPLWKDFEAGSVFYRWTNDSETLDRVREMITDVNPGLSSYQPTVTIIVTWLEATDHSGHRVS
jgi:hypothetical protein